MGMKINESQYNELKSIVKILPDYKDFGKGESAQIKQIIQNSYKDHLISRENYREALVLCLEAHYENVEFQAYIEELDDYNKLGYYYLAKNT